MLLRKESKKTIPENPLDTPWPLKYTRVDISPSKCWQFSLLPRHLKNRLLFHSNILLRGCNLFLEYLHASLLEQKILVFKMGCGLRHVYEAGPYQKILRAETGTIS
jgi:hypothetical protein